MGLLVPTDFDLRTIENGDEREVVGRLVDGLTDGWLIFPNVTFHSDRPHEIDVVLLHEEQGVVHLEVKGHRVYVQAGDWYGRQGKVRLGIEEYSATENGMEVWCRVVVFK